MTHNAAKPKTAIRCGQTLCQEIKFFILLILSLTVHSRLGFNLTNFHKYHFSISIADRNDCPARIKFSLSIANIEVLIYV